MKNTLKSLRLAFVALAFVLIGALPVKAQTTLDSVLVPGQWTQYQQNDGDVTRFVAATILTSSTTSPSALALPSNRLDAARIIAQASGTLVNGISPSFQQTPYPASFSIGGVRYADGVSLTRSLSDLVTNTTVVSDTIAQDAVLVKPVIAGVDNNEKVKVFITWKVAKTNRWPQL